MHYIFWIAMTYFLGSVPFGFIIAKIGCGIDPRTAGSKNIGATNVARLCGTGYGILALALDIAKGLVPVWMATVFSDSWLFLSLTALAAIIGHMYSCWLEFKGGKGFATTVGVFLALAPAPALISVVLSLGVIWLTGYVSMGALTFGAALPVLILLYGGFGLVPAALAATFLMYAKHRDNIARLARGEENPWRKKS